MLPGLGPTVHDKPNERGTSRRRDHAANCTLQLSGTKIRCSSRPIDRRRDTECSVGHCLVLSTGVVLWILHDHFSGYAIIRLQVNRHSLQTCLSCQEPSSVTGSPSSRHILRSPEPVLCILQEPLLTFVPNKDEKEKTEEKS